MYKDDTGEDIVIVNGLTKVYPGNNGKKKEVNRPAVDNISFSIRKGEIFGLIGPNGAGKTTTIKMLSTLLLPTSGSVKVMGYDVERQPMDIRKVINVVSGGERGLYYRLSGRQNLRFFADLYHVPIKVRDQRIEQLLDMVGLKDSGDRRIEEYSRGMKQRLHIARGLINDPEILFLDEPTIGLDPEIAKEIRDVVMDMSQRGKTVLLTTHNMNEAEELCNRIHLIFKGQIVAKGTPLDLKELVRDRTIVEVEAIRFPIDVIERIRQLPAVRSLEVVDKGGRELMRIQVNQQEGVMHQIASSMDRFPFLRISTEEPTLEEAYLGLVSKNA